MKPEKASKGYTDHHCILALVHTAPNFSLMLFLKRFARSCGVWGDQRSPGHPDTGMLHSWQLIHSGTVEIQQPHMHGFAVWPGTCLIQLGFHKIHGENMKPYEGKHEPQGENMKPQEGKHETPHPDNAWAQQP